MNWNHLHGNAWQSATIKRFEDDQWVPIDGGDDGGGGGGGGGGGEVPARFYTDGPPERSGDTITYAGTNYASLQAAHDDLSAGDTLYIDPDNGPYQERLQITRDQITVESDGAWLEQPDTDEKYTILVGEFQSGGHSFHPEEARLEGSHEGDEQITEISVTDASPFSVGDDIFIEEDRRPYGEPQSGGASGAETTHEYKVVTDVDTSNDTIAVHHPLFMPYPNSSETAVGRMDWVAEDVCLTGVNLRGSHSGNSPLSVHGARDVWVETIEVEGASDENVESKWTFTQTYTDVDMRNADDYGMNIARSSTQTYVSGVTADGVDAYTVRFGPGGGRAANSVDGYVENVTGRNLRDDSPPPLCNVHWGGFYVDYNDVTGDGDRLWRTRSRYITIDGAKEDGATRGTFTTRQRPFHCTARNVDVVNKVGGSVFNFNLREEEDERAGDLLFENITIEAYDGRSIADIGYFNDTAIIDGLTFRNVTYDGQQLSRSDVESWEGYDPDRITNLTVE